MRRLRRIVIVFGVEIRNYQSAFHALLAEHCEPAGDRLWRYPRGPAERATHEIRVGYDKATLAAGLATPGAFVVYHGHSRYGQGPAFGPADTKRTPDAEQFPINPWGVHYRMGYDATSTACVADLLTHSVTPTEYVLPAAPATAFLPGSLVEAAATARARQRIADRRGSCRVPGAWLAMDTCRPDLAAATTTRGETPLAGRHYYRHSPTPLEDLDTTVRVGSADLDRSPLVCSLFFMASCSSRRHFRRPLQRRRLQARSKCVFLLTSRTNNAPHASHFLKAVLLAGHDPATALGRRRLLGALNPPGLDSGHVGQY